jgi:hypothetical protein
MGGVHDEFGFSRGIYAGCHVELEQGLSAGAQLHERAVREWRLVVGIPAPLDQASERGRN